MKGLDQLAGEIAAAPRVGDEIVWRIKGDLRWNSGAVKAVMSGYRIVEIDRGGAWPVDRLSLADIDWHQK